MLIYLLIAFITISIVTLIIFKISNDVLKVRIPFMPLFLCAIMAIVLSYITPKYLFGTIGVQASFVILVVLAFIAAFLITKYDLNDADFANQEMEAAFKEVSSSTLVITSPPLQAVQTKDKHEVSCQDDFQPQTEDSVTDAPTDDVIYDNFQSSIDETAVCENKESFYQTTIIDSKILSEDDDVEQGNTTLACSDESETIFKDAGPNHGPTVEEAVYNIESVLEAVPLMPDPIDNLTTQDDPAGINTQKVETALFNDSNVLNSTDLIDMMDQISKLNAQLSSIERTVTIPVHQSTEILDKPDNSIVDIEDFTLIDTQGEVVSAMGKFSLAREFTEIEAPIVNKQADNNVKVEIEKFNNNNNIVVPLDEPNKISSTPSNHSEISSEPVATHVEIPMGSDDVVALKEYDAQSIEPRDLVINFEQSVNQAFQYKEQKNFGAALKELRAALQIDPQNDATPFIRAEIGNLLKNKGSYDEAIMELTLAKNFCVARNDELMVSEFINSIAYLRIIKNTLLENKLGYVPYINIPNDVKAQIDVNFKEWKAQG